MLMAPTETKNYDFNNVNLENFDLYGVLKHKRYTLTALDNLYKFNQDYLTAIHNMEKNNETFDYVPIHSRIASLSNNVTNNLIIKNSDELNKFLSLIRISTRLLRKSVVNNDLETLEASLSTLEYNVKLLNLF